MDVPQKYTTVTVKTNATRCYFYHAHSSGKSYELSTVVIQQTFVKVIKILTITYLKYRAIFT